MIASQYFQTSVLIKIAMLSPLTRDPSSDLVERCPKALVMILRRPYLRVEQRNSDLSLLDVMYLSHASTKIPHTTTVAKREKHFHGTTFSQEHHGT